MYAILRHRLACDDLWTDGCLSDRQQKSLWFFDNDGGEPELADGRHIYRQRAADAWQLRIFLSPCAQLAKLAQTG